MLFGLRFDFRNPAFAGVSTAERYAAALEMARWADGTGCLTIAVSEHHGADDGYLPSPLMMLAAMSAVTTNVRFMVAALIAPFYDTVRLAEDLVVLDNLSGGRVDVIVGGGYVPSEFEMYGADPDTRGARVAQTIEALRAAFAGEEFELDGRPVRVRPEPHRPGGPGILVGGTSAAAARRAVRLGLGFLPSTPDAWESYRAELAAQDLPDPGPSPVGESVVLAVAADVERGWEQLGPYFLHDANEYGRWQREAGIDSPYRSVADVDDLRRHGAHRIVTPDELVAEMGAAPFPFAMFHPMCGGIPPALAWEGLHLFEREVLPAFA